MVRLRRFWPVLFFALVAALPLWRALLLGETIGPFDQIRHMAPWNGPRPAQPWDVVQADGVLQFYAWRDMVFQAWGKGQMPYWNPYQLCGTPLLANSQSGAFYPPHIVAGVLHVPTPTALALLAWLHLFWGAWGLYALARRLGAGRIGATAGGVSFALSAFMLSWVALPSVISTVAWIPWVLLGVFAGRGTLGARRVSSLVGLSCSSAMLLLAGHLQFAAYGLMAAGLVAVWLLVEGLLKGKASREQGEATGDGNSNSGRPGQGALWGFGTTVMAVVLGGMLAAPQLLPVLEYGKFSHRANSPTEKGYEAFAGGALRPFELTGILYPCLLGDPTANVPDIDLSEGLPSYWPQYAKQGSNFAETAISLGPVVVLLLCFAHRRRLKSVLPLVGVGAFGLLVALGTPLARLLYFLVPGWSATGSTGRAAVLVVLAACVIGAVCIGEGEQEDRQGWKLYSPLLLFVALNALSMLALQMCGSAVTPFVHALNDSWASIVKLATGAGAKLSLLAAAACLAVGYAWLRQPRWGAYGVVVAAAAIPMLLCGNLVRSGSSDFLMPRVPDMHRYAFVNEQWDIVYGVKALMPPNTASAQRMHDVAGYDSLMHRDTVAMLADIDVKNAAADANGNIMFTKPSADPRKLADAGVTEVWSLKPLAQFGTPAAQGGDVYKYDLRGPGRAWTPGGPANIVEEGYDRLTVQAEGPGKLVVRDRNMPGWTAAVDGVAAPIGGNLWREVDLTAGKHTVVFRYRPPAFAQGLWAALIAIAVLCVAAVLRRRLPDSDGTPA